MHYVHYICRRFLHGMGYDTGNGIWCCFEEEQVMATLCYNQIHADGGLERRVDH